MPAPKSFTLDGKRYKLDPMVPTGFIRWRMGQVHVATSDAEIEAEMLARIAKNCSDVSASVKRQIVNYALACHRENWKQFRAVATGRL